MTDSALTAGINLAAAATQFAEEINARLRRIVKTTKRVSPLLGSDADDRRVTITVIDEAGPGTLPLTAGDKHLLDLRIKVNCCLDSSGAFLAVHESWGILHSLVVEFGVDRVDGWEAAVKEGRQQWRRLQLRAAVRDAPEEAADVLRRLGYDIKSNDAPAQDNLARMQAY